MYSEQYMSVEWIKNRKRLINIAELCRMAESMGYGEISPANISAKMIRGTPLTAKERDGFSRVINLYFGTVFEITGEELFAKNLDTL